MKTKEEISNLSDSDLVEYAKELRKTALDDIGKVQRSHGVKVKGILNSYGKGKEYLEVDLASYYKSFVNVIKKYVVPVEEEVKKRIQGNDEFYSGLHEQTYMFDLKRLEYFEENMPNSYIGRLTPRYTNPNWWVHLKKVRRLGSQSDYKEVVKERKIKEREDKIKGILDE